MRTRYLRQAARAMGALLLKEAPITKFSPRSQVHSGDEMTVEEIRKQIEFLEKNNPEGLSFPIHPRSRLGQTLGLKERVEEPGAGWTIERADGTLWP
jgi:hypothetical protein